jgi:hypothetical protein
VIGKDDVVELAIVVVAVEICLRIGVEKPIGSLTEADSAEVHGCGVVM